MRSAVPQKLRSGKALRKSVMNALISSRPRRGSCREYCRSMLGAASSSTMLRSQVSPQKLVNQRPTIALFSDSFDMLFSFGARIYESRLGQEIRFLLLNSRNAAAVEVDSPE